ncbi:MAG TPA: hypothetical protein VIU82_20410 [Bosea sp. (in: a-proteobacteria)]
MTTARNVIALFFLHVVAASALTLMSDTASAQSQPAVPPHVPLQKAIGTPAKPELVPSLFVLSARGATLQGGKLVLSGLSPNAIVFADRPVRSAGHELTAHILEEWLPSNQSPDSFFKDPPNATVSVFVKDGSGVRDAVVVLKTPKLEGDRVTFDVDVLEGDLAGGDGAASIFIDLIGRPFTPLSFAGVARRSAFRGAYYRGAAIAAGAGALGAAAYYAPYAYRPVCGYYPYPPCY